MKNYKHINASNIEDAANIIHKKGSKAAFIAGGTDLLGGLKSKIHKDYPDFIVNLKTIPDLEYVSFSDKEIKIGSLTRLSDIENNKKIKNTLPILAAAAKSVASPEIRNMGTIGGNICQENRCWYYRNSNNIINCARKDGKYCYALTGENQMHSIFGAMRVEDPPCKFNCPSSINIPVYLNKIRRNDFDGAARTLLENNPLPAITGRVCPHFCETECNRGDYDEAISIREIERHLGDFILQNPDKYYKISEKSNCKNVAIIGAGPAGLSAAYYLAKVGYSVTVFDNHDEPGGMLRYGIPEYRLPSLLVDKLIKAFKGMGIQFKTNEEVGKTILFEKLKKDFDSIFISTGAWKQPSIGIINEEKALSGLDFLVKLKKKQAIDPGKKVVVIGGGNVACDVSLSALRSGAKQVTMICLESREEMPALDSEIAQSVEEGVQILNGWGPTEVKLTEEGKIKGVEFVRCLSVFNSQNKFDPVFNKDERNFVDADTIYLAVGQWADTRFVDDYWNLNRINGFIKTDKTSHETSINNVYAGGDVCSGPATVVEAICSGKEVANEINQALGGYSKNEFNDIEYPLQFNIDYMDKRPKLKLKDKPLSDRFIDKEDSDGCNSEEVFEEANRCFNCGCVAVNPSDIAPALIAMNGKIVTNKRTILSEDFFEARKNKSTILDDDEVVKEIVIPINNNAKQTYKKYRIRSSIDFPLVSVAIMCEMENDTIKNARVVLGAVAPIPIRIKEAEKYLTGKSINDVTAKEVSNLCVNNALPLKKNEYKIQITKSLIRRSILEFGN